MDVGTIADLLNARAASLAPNLLPNGHSAGNYWMASGIADTGQSASLAVHLKGAQIGHWRDHGNAASQDEEKGDMLDLVRLIHCGGDMAAAVRWAKAELGIEDSERSGGKPAMSPEEKARRAEAARERAVQQERKLEEERLKKSRNAKRLYLRGEPIHGTGAAAYLEGRGILPLLGTKPWPGSLRFHPAVRYAPLGIDAPVMLGAVYTAEGQQIGTHRTYLREDAGGCWRKIEHSPAKMMLGCKAGGFVPINQGASGKSMRDMAHNEPVYVTEGIEDALCVRILKPDARIIAAIDLGNIAKLILPEKAARLVIVADRDEGEKQQAGLERAIVAQQARGLTVELVMPPEGIKDINEWVQAAMPARRRA